MTTFSVAALSSAPKTAGWDTGLQPKALEKLTFTV